MATNYNTSIITDGLVLCLDAANTKSYPGTGTTWTDLSSIKTNASMNSGVTYYSDGSKSSMVFAGANLNYVNTIRQDPQGQSLSWTTNAWIKYSNVGYISWMTIIDQAAFPSASNYMMWLSSDAPSSGKLLATYDGAWRYGATRLYPNIWYNVCLTRASNIVNYYINGIFDIQRTFTNTLTLNTGNICIGNHPNNPGYLFNGNISNVSIYNNALSADEVLQNFNATRGRYGI